MSRALLSFALAALAASSLAAQSAAPLPEEQRTNGEETLKALGWLEKAARESLVQILGTEGRPALRGALVSADGYFVTKASEAPSSNVFTVVWPDGDKCEARRMRVDAALDIMLAKASKKGIPLTWKSSTSLQAGDWIVSGAEPQNQGCTLRLGVVSARRRAIAGHGVAMGIAMSDTSADKGVRITQVASESPAEAAGLKEDDLLVALDDEPVYRSRQVKDIISQFHPGEEIKLRVRRGQAENILHVRLASLSKVMSNWDGEDYANGGVSLRTDNFPDIIQHEIPLQPSDMGGPLLDLEGNGLGINISRVDRVTTFVLPMEQFITKVQQWMVESRRTLAGH